MNDTRRKYVEASVRETAFNCPHCGVLTTQYWYSIYADSLPAKTPPVIITKESFGQLNFGQIEDVETKKKFVSWAEKMLVGRPFIEANATYRAYDVHNLTMSRCYECDELAIWI